MAEAAGPLQIRRMEEGDLPQVMQIEKESFTAPWSESSMRQELLSDRAYYFVAIKNGLVAGYAGFWQVVDEGHIMNIAVSTPFRRQGIGRALLTRMVEAGDRLGIFYWTLEVRDKNRAAQGLYETFGFQNAGIRPGYYEKPREDARIYWLIRGKE